MTKQGLSWKYKFGLTCKKSVNVINHIKMKAQFNDPMDVEKAIDKT